MAQKCRFSQVDAWYDGRPAVKRWQTVTAKR
jgi:hypothetical protein